MLQRWFLFYRNYCNIFDWYIKALCAATPASKQKSYEVVLLWWWFAETDLLFSTTHCDSQFSKICKKILLNINLLNFKPYVVSTPTSHNISTYFLLYNFSILSQLCTVNNTLQCMLENGNQYEKLPNNFKIMPICVLLPSLCPYEISLLTMAKNSFTLELNISLEII